jgi:hypothetical protein
MTVRRRQWPLRAEADRSRDCGSRSKLALHVGWTRCHDGSIPKLTKARRNTAPTDVAKFRNFATRLALNGCNGLAGAQMSRKIRALKSPGRLVGHPRVSTAQQDLTRQVRALANDRFGASVAPPIADGIAAPPKASGSCQFLLMHCSRDRSTQSLRRRGRAVLAKR